MEEPRLAKSVWTDADFDEMGWHDNAVHGWAVEPAMPYPGRLLLDLDYIVQWVPPDGEQTAFRFWICPATLVFDQASDFQADVDLRSRAFEMSLDAIQRDGPDAWTLAGHEFTIRLNAPGFTQYLRQPPILSPAQRLTTKERNGVSFEARAFKV